MPVEGTLVVANCAIVTVSHSGVVSILRNVTRAEAEAIKERLTPWWRRPGAAGGITFSIADGDLTRIEIIDPDEPVTPCA